MTPLVKEVVALDPELALSCIWFDLCTLPHYTFSWADLPGSRLPFERCAIVGRDSKGDKFLLLAMQGDETTIILAATALLPDRHVHTPLFAVEMFADEGGCRIAQVEGEKEITRERAAPIVGILASFLRMANPTGFRASAKQNSITNRRRAAHGKPPLIYDWHTVVIEPPTERTRVACGGTHASPRQHERRGHWRTCASGKRVWVRNCTVGNPALGAVFKDYRVEPAEVETPEPVDA